MATKTKVTDSFTVTADDGHVHSVQEHTRNTEKRVSVVHRWATGAAANTSTRLAIAGSYAPMGLMRWSIGS